MTFITYAQNFEDVLLWRALKHIENGFYIDVGAWSPDIDSVTRAFYERGWRGINIEPNSEFHAQLMAHRIRDINLRIAISDKPGTLIMNFLSNPGLSTLDEAIAKRHASTGLTIDKQDVVVTNLATLWKQHVPEDQEVHFLKIDVEGFEEAVLRGNDWTKNRPWIVVVEATLPMSQQESHDTWEPILLSANYCFAYADGINRFYVAIEHAELLPALKYPPNFFDDFKSNAQHQAESSAQQVFPEASATIMVERERAKWFENEWNATKSRAEKHIGELAEVRDRTIQHDFQLTERSQTLDSATHELNMERERVKWLENEWNATKSKAEMRIGELAVVRDQTIQLEFELTNRSQALDSATQALNKERECVKWLENEWNAAKVKVDELNGSSHYWWAMADYLNHELQSVKSSYCWRVSRPLRDGFDLLFRVWIMFASIPKTVKGSIQSLFSSILAELINFSLDHPKIKLQALALLRRSPALEAQLRRFAAARGMIPGGKTVQIYSMENFERSIELSNLTPSVHRVYVDLKAAIERQNKGSS
ncbi:MAG: FkbM family methyltransferase [Methanothrix sp.]|nr:FkbM family methyltransferase [Methanothrix sp.]